MANQTTETAVIATERTRPAAGGLKILTVKVGEAPSLGDRIFAEKMAGFLNDTFPDSVEVSPDEFGEAIIELTQRAAYYKLTLEHHVAAFMVAAWVMGKDFDVAFQSAQAVLNNLDISSEMKAEWLWTFVETAADILENAPR